MNFNWDKDVIIVALFVEFNEKVFDVEFSLDFEVMWNKKLLIMVGLIYYKCLMKFGEIMYSVCIELFNKVLDIVEKFEFMLFYEMCYVFVWFVDKIVKLFYGLVFKKWVS